MKAQHLIIGGLLATAVTVSVLSENLVSTSVAKQPSTQLNLQQQSAPTTMSHGADPVKMIETAQPVVVDKSVEPEKYHRKKCESVR